MNTDESTQERAKSETCITCKGPATRYRGKYWFCASDECIHEALEAGPID